MKTADLFLTSLVLLSFSCWSDTGGSEELKEDASAQIERGQYLVGIIGCEDCHSPKLMTPEGPVPDPDRHLSGHPADQELAAFPPELVNDWALFGPGNTAVAGPWGVSFAANITSDPTGIGTWSEEQFFLAMREGKYKGLPGSRLLLPPMPWEAFSRMNDADIRAVFAYLKSTPPVRNIVPLPIPPKS